MHVGRKVVFTIAANVAGAALGYGALLVIGRTFQPAAYGAFVFALSVSGFFALATTLGLGNAHQRLVAQGVEAHRVLGTAARLRFALMAAGLLVLLLGGLALRAWGGPQVFDATTPAVLAAAVALQVAAMVRQLFAETWAGRQDVGRVESVRVLDAGVLLLVLANAGLVVAHLNGRPMPFDAVGAWWAGLLGLHGPIDAAEAAWVLAGCALAAKLVSLLAAGTWAVRDGLRLGPYDAAVARQMWAFGLPIALTAAIGLLVQYTDVLLLGFFWTAREVGLYGTAQKLAALAALAAGAAGTILLARFSQLAAQGRAGDAAATFDQAERWLLILGFGVAANLAALAPAVIHVAVGDPYLGAATPLRLLAANAAVFALHVPLSARFMGHGRTRVLVTASAANALINAALNLVLIPRQLAGWGTAGAALATLVSTMAAYVLLRRAGRRAFGVPAIGTNLPRVLAAILPPALGWAAVFAYLPHTVDRVWELVGWSVLGWLAFALLLRATGALRPADAAWVRSSIHPGELLRELRGR